MPEDTPDQQETPPGQQETPAPTTPPGEDYKPRYTGAVQKIETLTLELKQAQTELATKASELEQLNAQLGLKDTEKDVAVRARDKQLEEALTANQASEVELAKLRALQLKVEIANELKNPRLMQIAQSIPDLTDKEVLTQVMKDFDSFANDAVKEREAQLMAGITPQVGPGPVTTTTPVTEDAWKEKIAGFELGSPQRVKALNDYGDWLEKEHTNKQ